MSSELNSLESKLNNKHGESYVQNLLELSKKELEFKLLELAKHKEEVVTTRNNDEEYQLAKEKVKDLNAPYKEQLGENKLKARYIHLLIKDRFTDEDKDS